MTGNERQPDPDKQSNIIYLFLSTTTQYISELWFLLIDADARSLKKSGDPAYDLLYGKYRKETNAVIERLIEEQKTDDKN